MEKRMFESLSHSERSIAIQRLTALWALTECGLGGFLHALQSPFTGLLVGSIAMVCIAFICSLSSNSWPTLMTSLTIVLVIKALVSPHSTPTAYIAVIFQGITGAVIYRYGPGLLISSLLFVSLGLMESALQRLLTLTILYGNTLWEAINLWGDWAKGQWGLILPVSSSRFIILIYLAIHLIAGIGIGWLIYKMIVTVSARWGEVQYQLSLSGDDKKNFMKVNDRKGIKWKRYVLFFVLTILIFFAYIVHDEADGMQKGLIAILRALAILILWFVFIAPAIVRFLQKLFHKKHHQLSAEISRTMDMFPQIIWIIDKAWKETRHLRFVNRWKSFLLDSFLYILQYTSYHDPDPDRADQKP